MNREELLKKFEVIKVKRNDEFTAQYKINITMDENDADYRNCDCTFTEEQWNNLPLVVLLCLSYCAKGSFTAEKARFNVGGWNGYGYGHHITENEDFPWIVDVMSDYGMIEYGFDGYCHSYESIEIEYYDEHSVRHDIAIPDFDELFKNNSKEEVVEIMNAAYAEYVKEME